MFGLFLQIFAVVTGISISQGLEIKLLSRELILTLTDKLWQEVLSIVGANIIRLEVYGLWCLFPVQSWPEVLVQLQMVKTNFTHALCWSRLKFWGHWPSKRAIFHLVIWQSCWAWSVGFINKSCLERSLLGVSVFGCF